MKHEIVLPFAKPLIVHAPMDTYLLSILGSQIASYSGWIFSNYINIQIEQENLFDTFCPADLLLRCPLLETYGFNYADCLNEFQTFSDFCKHAVNSGNYIYLIVNELYIKQYAVIENVEHNPIIYGYNDESKRVYIADFFNGAYTFSTVTFEELDDAVIHLKDIATYGSNGTFFCEQFHCWLLRPKTDEKDHYPFDLDKCINETKLFLNSTNLQLIYKKSFYGLSCFQHIINCNPTTRSLSLFHGITVMWKLRLQYMRNIELIDNNFYKHLETVVDDCCKQAEVNIMLYLKYLYRQSNSDADLAKIKSGIELHCTFLVRVLEMFMRYYL